MILIYRETPSESANKLVEELRELGAAARRVKTRARLLSLMHAPSFEQRPHVVSWGAHTGLTGTLNEHAGNSEGKFHELQTLAAAGVVVPAHSLTRPRLSSSSGGCDARCEHCTAPARIITSAPDTSYLPRRFNHMGGHDLLRAPTSPDYWVQKVEVDSEYRVHVFQGAVIRLGVRVKAREDAHPWIRSYDAGWRLSYGNEGNRSEVILRAVRDAGKRAVAALGLDFGAVDVGYGGGEHAQTTVFEVNSAPGLDGGTLEKYAVAIKAWSEQ